MAIFIHGCFWHGHSIGCRYTNVPKSKTDYRITKISNTQIRDQKHINELKNMGWRVIVVWECEIQTDFEKTVEKIICELDPL